MDALIEDVRKGSPLKELHAAAKSGAKPPWRWRASPGIGCFSFDEILGAGDESLVTAVDKSMASKHSRMCEKHRHEAPKLRAAEKSAGVTGTMARRSFLLPRRASTC